MVIMLTATGQPSSSEAPGDFNQKNGQSYTEGGAKQRKTTRQMPSPERIGRSTARGGRFITSSSCGSNEITKHSATEVTMLTNSTWGAVIGMVKPRKIATMIT